MTERQVICDIVFFCPPIKILEKVWTLPDVSWKFILHVYLYGHLKMHPSDVLYQKKTYIYTFHNDNNIDEPNTYKIKNINDINLVLHFSFYVSFFKLICIFFRLYLIFKVIIFCTLNYISNGNFMHHMRCIIGGNSV